MSPVENSIRKRERRFFFSAAHSTAVETLATLAGASSSGATPAESDGEKQKQFRLLPGRKGVSRSLDLGERGDGRIMAPLPNPDNLP
jgi:hypothetical protein